MVFQYQVTLQTSGHRDIHDLTDQVQQIVERSGVQAGLAHVFNVGSMVRRSRKKVSQGWPPGPRQVATVQLDGRFRGLPPHPAPA